MISNRPSFPASLIISQRGRKRDPSETKDKWETPIPPSLACSPQRKWAFVPSFCLSKSCELLFQFGAVLLAFRRRSQNSIRKYASNVHLEGKLASYSLVDVTLASYSLAQRPRVRGRKIRRKSQILISINTTLVWRMRMLTDDMILTSSERSSS